MKILNSIEMVDHKLFYLCFSHKIRLQKYAFYVSKTGDGFLQVIFPLAYLLANIEFGLNFKFTTLFGGAFLFERCVYLLTKNNLKRRRPPDALPNFKSLINASDAFSFPSGHTSAAFLFATLCVLWFGFIALPVYLWALAVGASRVLLGVHFPTDILAGATIGTAIGVLFYTYI